MSATARPISLHTRDSAPAAVAFSIRWEISSRALLASAPAAALLNGEAPRLASAALLWHIHANTARAELALDLTDGAHHAIPLVGPLPITITHQPDSALIHIDAPGAIHLTLRESDEPAILFARTALLSGPLALPGGVYDAPAIASLP